MRSLAKVAVAVLCGLALTGFMYRQDRSLEILVVEGSRLGPVTLLKTAPQKQVKILIHSYMRSGSTLTGDLFQAHPGVFFFYEPLWYLYDHDMNHSGYWDQEDLRSRVKDAFKSVSPTPVTPFDFLDRMFQCDLSPANLAFLAYVMKSESFSKSQCPFGKPFGRIQETQLKPCAELVKPRCEEAKSLVMKVLRLTMNETDSYLDKHPDLKVIYLVRDPRGIHYSRGQAYFQGQSSFLCQRIQNDLTTFKRISGKHKGRILLVRYEDLAQLPLHVVKEMYQFAGLDMLPSVEETVRQKTHAESTHETQFGTGRSDSSKTSTKWRTTMTYQAVKEMDAYCQDVYSFLGYNTFASDNELRNLTLPQRSPDYDARLVGVRIGHLLKDRG
ncbi:carbohydrate sulfotransferase 4 [Aplysia californica]|uniref:Carbohydrate sulfotransferase 4 n=1 Tax=Aplysia californica TaxID=6500 RepID=A0ABM0JLD0_APLCA|nr:carbohydrate sulfotransferase 4 [Aplysia californica]